MKMFNVEEKKKIAQTIEEVILSFNHPEMPKENVSFSLHVDGKESWSWADINPNWTFENKKPLVNPWNEVAREKMGKGE